MAFFKRKSSVKEDIKSDDEIQSLLEAALEPVSKQEDQPTQPNNIPDSYNKDVTLDEVESSIYEDLLKSADLPSLSDEDILQAEKADALNDEKLSKINAKSMAQQAKAPQDRQHKDDNLTSVEPLQQQAGSSATPPVGEIKDTPLASTKPLTLEEKIDAQLLKGASHSALGQNVDTGAVRIDVARISADIQSGEELYRRAQMRIESLTQFVQRAEVDTAALRNLEPENRELKLLNQDLLNKIDQKTREISILESDLEDHRERLASREEAAKQSQARLAKASKSLHDYELALASAQKTAEQNYLKLERNETALDVERRENKLLQEKMKALSKALDNKNLKLLEAEKTSASLREDCAVLKTQTAKLEDKNSGFKNALDETTKQNNFMKGKLVSLHEDIRNYKVQSESNLTTREERIFKLEHQITELTRQVEIKDEILCNTARDVSDLRKARSAHNEERDRLEQKIDSLSQQLSDAQNKLLRAGKDTTNLDKRYHDVTEAIAKAQANHPVQTPSDSSVAELHQAPKAPRATNVISETEIANKILNYKRDMQTGTS